MSARAGRAAVQIASLKLIAALATIGASAGARADTKGSYAFAPYLKLKASESDQSVDVGLQYAPLSGFGFVGRFTVTAARRDETQPTSELSIERPNVGTRVQLLWELPTRVPPEILATGLSRFGAGLNGRWSVAKYEWNPGGGTQQSRFDHTFKLELQGWWFGSTKASSAAPGPAPKVEKGSPPPGALKPTEYEVSLFQPQVRVSFARAWKEADDSFVVRPLPATGPQVAEKLKLTPPTGAPTLSVLVALAVEPSGWKQFAIAPAARFTTQGDGGGASGSEWDPTRKVSRVRLEFWGYLFAFGDETSRIGAAPFVDVRASGSDKRDAFVVGAVAELRTGTSRLEY